MTKEVRPLVSISCVTYNHASFLRQCLDGFFMQQCNFEFEILINDDASSDGTQEIIREYMVRYPGVIKPIFQPENQYSKGVRSMSSTFNFPRAQGKYIAICEGDDYWIDPLKLQKQVDFMEDHPDYNLSVGRVLIIDEKGNMNFIHEFANPSKRKTYALKDYIAYRFSQTSSFFFRNFIFPEIFYNVFSGDQALVISAANNKKIYYHDDIFSHYRINSQSVSFTENSGTRYKQMISFWEKVNLFTNYNFPLSVYMNRLLIKTSYKAKQNKLYKILNIFVKGAFILRVRILYKYKEIFNGI